MDSLREQMSFCVDTSNDCQGSRLTCLLTSPVASDNFDFTSQNQFSTSQNFQAWSCIFFVPRGGGGGTCGRVDILTFKLCKSLGKNVANL